MNDLDMVQGAVNSVLWRSTAYAQRGMAFGIQVSMRLCAESRMRHAATLGPLHASLRLESELREAAC